MKIIDSHAHLDKETDLGTFLAGMRANGIGRAVFSNLGDHAPYPDSESIRRDNDEAWGLTRRNPGRLSYLSYLNPQLPDWPEELHRNLGRCVGVKLWVSVRDSRSGSLERTIGLLRECGRLRLPVLLHIFDRTLGNHPGEADIMEVAELAAAAPECILVAAHAGACFHDGAGLFRRMPSNVLWDISGSFPACDLLKRLLAELPSDRILFGSDAPARSFSSQLLKVAAAHPAPEQLDRILWRNAARIYHLPEPPEIVPERPLEAPARSTDYHCYCGHDPFGVAPGHSPEELEEFLGRRGVERAYCADLDSILLWDPTEENRRFCRRCEGLGIVRPLWTVNPQAHNFRLCAEAARDLPCAGLWASSYWSAIAPDHPNLVWLGTEAGRQGRRFFLHVGGPAEDRFRHPAVAPREASPAEIEGLLAKIPATEVVIQSQTPPPIPVSASHRWAAPFPLDRTDSPLDRPDLLFGSGFPYRSFPASES